MIIYSALSDHDLICLLKQDDRKAFMEVYHRYKNLLQSHICKKLGDFEASKDVLQDTFTTLWVKRNDLVSTANLSGYLYIIARNKVFNYFSRKQSQNTYIQSLQAFINEGDFVTDNMIRERELDQMIKKEINMLPSKMKEVFVLSRSLGYTHKEIADRLGIAEQTVSKQITNALKVLKVKLGVISLLLVFLFS